MTYVFLQHYWWFLVSLLGALLVFLMFVQGANSLISSLGRTPEGMRMVLNSTGRKWEITFTTLVTFGGAFFASFPLFYSTSFGGAYWVWMLILLTFVLQAVSYEFQNKLGNILGPKTFRFFLVLNGVLGPFLIGTAVATFFNGSNFVIEKASLMDQMQPIISRWANASNGLDAVLDPWNLMLGFAVLFLARILGILYVMNNVNDEDIRSRGSVRLVGNTVAFLIFFLAFVIRTLLKDGYALNPQSGEIFMEPFKYLNNLVAMWPLLILLLIGVVCVPCEQDFCERYLAGRYRNGAYGSCVAAHRGMEQYRLLSFKRRFAEFADHSEQLFFGVHAAHHVLRVAAHPVCTGLYSLLLVFSRQKENHQGGNQRRGSLLEVISDEKTVVYGHAAIVRAQDAGTGAASGGDFADR